MRRSGLVAFMLAACSVPQLLHARTPRPRARGAMTPHAHIIANTFSSAMRDPESGPFTFTITVQNSGTAGVVGVTCWALSSQLPCGSVSPEGDGVYLANGETQEFTVGFSTIGVGHFSVKFRALDGLVEAITPRDSVTFGVTVAGSALQTHLTPVEGQRLTSSDSLVAFFQSGNGINTSTLKLFVDGTNYTSSSQVSGTTIRRIASGLTAGTHRLTTYGCTNGSRCDSVSTNFTIVGSPGPVALDDSLPPMDAEGVFGTLPGALPLPPENLRGCPVNAGDPDIVLQSPGLTVYQPTSPQGYMFWAGLGWDNTITIAASTVDNLPTSSRHCSGLPWVEYTDYDWNYWSHSDPDDPLWDSYPYGDRSGGSLRALPMVVADHTAVRLRRRGGGRVRGELSDLDPRHPLFEATRAWRQGQRTPPTSSGTPGPATAEPIRLVRGLVARRAPVLPRRNYEPIGGVLPSIWDAGAIDTSSYWVKLNGTYIVQNGAPVYSGVAMQYLARSGSSFTIPSSAAVVYRYNAAQPGSSPNGGWNEIIASIADSSGHRTSIRSRFAVIDPGAPADLALTPMRDYRQLEQGECAAFGAFQCGSVTLVQTIPGYVTRDRDRSLHLVYRSASQRAPLILPFQVAVDRYQMAPDSVKSWISENGVAVPDSMKHRYAGSKCNPSCSSFQLLDERANEWRVVSGELAAPATGNVFGPLTINVRGYYPGQVHDNAYTQDVTRLYWTDTTSTRFGAGWQVAELGRLIFITPSTGAPATIYARGDGSYTVYRSVGGVYVAPPGERGRLVDRSDGDYSYYAIEFPDGSAVGFQSDGMQRFTRDVLGNKTYYDYNAGRLTHIQDPAGIWYDFVYDGGGRASEIRIALSGVGYTRLATFAYGTDRLTSVALWADDSHADTTQFTYLSGAPGAYLATVTDPRGQQTSFTYDSRFWTPTSVVRPSYLGVRDTAFYRDPLRRAAPREGWGRSSNAQERLLGINQARGTFLGIATTPTDVEVDPFGAPTMVRHFAPPQSLGYSFVPDELRHIERDSTGRVTKIVAGRDYYGSNADSVRYQYDAHGNLSRLIRSTAQWPTAGIVFDTTSYTYDSVTTGLPFTYQRCVRMRTMRDPMGGVDSVTYGGSGAALCLPSRMRGMAGDTTTFAYSLSLGTAPGVRPVTVVDAAGIRRDMTYDATTWNSVTSVRYADGATFRAHYDYFGRPDSTGRVPQVVEKRFG